MIPSVSSLLPETEVVLAVADEAAAWPTCLPTGTPRRDRLQIAARPQGPHVVEWVSYAHRRIRQGFGFIGPAGPAIRESDARPAFFTETPPPSTGADAPVGILVCDAVLALFLSRDLPSALLMPSEDRAHLHIAAEAATALLSEVTHVGLA